MLQDTGRVTAEIAKAHAEAEFEKYRIVQDRLFESDFDRVVVRAAVPSPSAAITPPCAAITNAAASSARTTAR